MLMETSIPSFEASLSFIHIFKEISVFLKSLVATHIKK